MYDNWNELEKSIENCKKCRLSDGRNNIVFGDGNISADLMIIGEEPCKEDDEQGKLFVGHAGELMNMAFEGLNINKNDIYFANIIKCRSPLKRDLDNSEISICLDYLRNQVILVKPKIIVILGNAVLKTILGASYNITETRGKWIERKGIWYMVTFHPEDLLRDEKKKIYFWQDLKQVQNKLIQLNSTVI